ncbi:MAG: hypothetical protein WC560_00450 [Syntrophales bacterium]
MSRLKDITSTEKLLDLIRSKKDSTAPDPVQKPDIDPPKEKKNVIPLKTLSEKRTINVGVDIGHEYLRMVKTAPSNDNRWTLIDWRSVSLSHITSRKLPEFNNFLRNEISKFCGTYKNLHLWAIMSSARVNVRHIRIPKVAKKHIENAIYWTVRKELPFDEKETVFDYEIQGEITEGAVQKLSAMVYTAPRYEIEGLKKQFNEIGFPLDGISVASFAIQNIFLTEWLPAAESTLASLFIGNDFSRIDIYARGKLTMTRGIKAGINSMVESLQERINELLPKLSGIEGEPIRTSMEEARKVFFSLSPDFPPLTAGDVGFTLKEEEKFAIILPALERVIRQVERTFKHYSTNLGYDRVDKIYVSSVMSLSMPIIACVGDQLAIESDILDPFKFLQLPLPQKDTLDISMPERIALTPALGLALSDHEYTPNFLVRSKNKEKLTNVARITRVAFASLITVALICAGVFLSQLHAINQKKSEISQLEEQLLQYKPRVDQKLLSRMAATSKQLQQASKAYSDRYLGTAIIGELSEMTPENVRLIDLKVYLGSAKHQIGAKKERAKNLVMEGLILGDRKTLDVLFADYIMKLERSPMFQQVSIKKNSVEHFKRDDVLHFIIDIGIG